MLAAEMKLAPSTEDSVRAKMAEYGEHRKSTQPPGASMGSMFKNPAGDKAGRLIEAAGLKGRRHGNVEVSPVHGNFFVNHGQATAADVEALIQLVQNDRTGSSRRGTGARDRGVRRIGRPRRMVSIQ